MEGDDTRARRRQRGAEVGVLRQAEILQLLPEIILVRDIGGIVEIDDEVGSRDRRCKQR
jgi:hypothetical protein